MSQWGAPIELNASFVDATANKHWLMIGSSIGEQHTCLPKLPGARPYNKLGATHFTIEPSYVKNLRQELCIICWPIFVLSKHRRWSPNALQLHWTLGRLAMIWWHQNHLIKLQSYIFWSPNKHSIMMPINGRIASITHLISYRNQ